MRQLLLMMMLRVRPLSLLMLQLLHLLHLRGRCRRCPIGRRARHQIIPVAGEYDAVEQPVAWLEASARREWRLRWRRSRRRRTWRW